MIICVKGVKGLKVQVESSIKYSIITNLKGLAPLEPRRSPVFYLWNRESRLTTLVDVCVLTPIGPPYGVIGKMCEVPLRVETATHLESGLNAMSCTDPGVSPLYREYRWCTVE